VNNINPEADFFRYQSTLVLIPSIKYNEIIIQVPKQLAEKSICYVTLNKTYNALVEIFCREKINLENIVFIDAITRSISRVENSKNCYYVSSPQALTELSIAITELLKQNVDYLIFDSLTTLLLYQRAVEPVIQFISNTVNKIKKYGGKGVFYVLNIHDHQLLIEESFMIMDKIIDSKYIGSQETTSDILRVLKNPL
jgi:hypothetical protein